MHNHIFSTAILDLGVQKYWVTYNLVLSPEQNYAYL